MRTVIRALEDADHDAVIALSLRAWAPVFASLRQVLNGSGVYERLYPDWRQAQRQAVGARLTSFAVDRISDRGMAVAMVETGGDPGHAPARRTYQRAGFTELRVSRYFKKL